MGLQISAKKRVGYKIASLIAIFAVVAQPMYGLVAEQVAKAMTVNYTFPSTNDINKTTFVKGKQAPNVELVESRVGEVEVRFNNQMNQLACFEYRIDGQLSGTHLTNKVQRPLTLDGRTLKHNVIMERIGGVLTGDELYPQACLGNRTETNFMTSLVHTFTATDRIEVRMALGGERDYDSGWVTFNTLAPSPIVTVTNFNTHSGTDYHGVNVGFNINNDFGAINAVKVELFKDSELLVANTHNQALLDLINGGERELSTPFVTSPGTYTEEYWNLGEHSWSPIDKPTSAKVTVTGTNGTKDATLISLSEPNGWNFSDLILSEVPTGLKSTMPSTNRDITNGATNINQVRNSWSVVDGATSYNYQFRKPGLPTYSRNNTTATSVQGEFHNANSPEGTYGFRVQAVKANGVVGPWSDWSSVTYDKTNPVVEDISISPMVNGNIGGKVTIQFSINDISGIDTTKSQVLFADGPGTSQLAKESPKASFTHVSGDTYQAVIDTTKFVKANYVGKYTLTFNLYDNAGNSTSSKPKPFRSIFIDNSGPGSTLLGPSSGSRVGGVTVLSLGFSDDTGVKSARIRLSNIDTGFEKWYDATVLSDSMGELSVDTTKLPDGEYSVAIRPVDSFGQPRSGANKGIIIINNTAPKAEVAVGDLSSGDFTNDKNVVVKGIGTPAPFGTDIKTHFFELKTPGGATHSIYSFKNTADKQCELNGLNECSFELGKYYDGDGKYEIRYVVTDQQDHRNDGFRQPWLAGVNPVKFVFNVDATAPILTISVDQTDGTNTARTISGTTDDKMAPVVVKLGSEERTIQPKDFTDNGNGTFGWSATFANLGVANHRATVYSQDGRGNLASQVSVDFEVEKAVTEGGGNLARQTTTTPPPSQTAQPPVIGGLVQTFTTTPAVLADEDNTINPANSPRVAQNNGGVLDADDNRANADAQAGQKGWSLANLLMTIVAGIIGLVALFGLGKKEGRVARILAVAIAAGAVSAFLIKEDMSQPMGLVNLWTIAFVAVPIAQIALLSLKKDVAKK